MAYYLERDTEDGPYVRARVNHERNGLVYDEIFEIGEPIYLKSIRLKTSDYAENKIWWIQGFDHARGEAKVFITTLRGGCPGELGAPLGELEKVPAMLRLALESR